MKGALLLAAIITGNTLTASAQATATGPHLLVYKTKKNYSKLVPVILSADKTKIVSYPDPVDIKKSGKGMKPLCLKDGYLLDNYGVGPNTAYLDITRTKYAAMKTAPPTGELYKKILEKNPLTILYDCGLKAAYKSPVKQANKLIKQQQLNDSCQVMLTNR